MARSKYVLAEDSQYIRARVEGKVVTATEPVELTKEEVQTLEGMGVNLTEKKPVTDSKERGE